jgi:metal-responsive CopG/Arc/MetJ family transcriptional regulator
MSTDKPRILLTLSEELLEEIDDYRYKNRIPARTEAIRQLIKKALPKKKSKKDQSDKQNKLF